MRLTTKERWHYSQETASEKYVDKVFVRDEYLAKILEIVPDGEMDYLELGCAPGTCSATLCRDRKWTCSGIDYSDEADLFVETLKSIGRDAALYKFDFFKSKLDRKFDVVASFGLVEHFRGATLDEVFQIHDAYLQDGGYLVIEMPNLTGFHYLWHYLFDKPDLDNHNVDVMQPQALSWFEENGYTVLFNDYVGTMRLWGNSGWTWNWFTGKSVAAIAKFLSLVARFFARLGLKLSGQSFAPALLYIAKKSTIESKEQDS